MPFFAMYPDGHFVPRWIRYFTVYSAVLTVFWSFFPNLFLGEATPLVLFGVVSVALLIGACLYAQVWRYRHYATPLQRQQSKWLLYALAIVMASTLFQLVLPVMQGGSPSDALGEFVTMLVAVTQVCVPIAVGFSILRYRLWDIDILIRKTVTYGLLTAALLLVYFGMVVLLQRLLAALTGAAQNELITVISTLVIAALFIPLRNRIQHWIDHRFYRSAYDAQKVLQQFAARVRDETDLESLSGQLIQVVDGTMKPRSVSLWLTKEREAR
jgi:hypothetical protein